MADYAAKRAALGRSPSPPPEIRCKVLISSEDGIFFSAGRLQELAELPELPEVLEAPFAKHFAGSQPEGPTSKDTIRKICICDITLSEMGLVHEKAHVERYGDMECIWYQGRWLNVDVVLGLKRVLIS
ncbi:hypothetical protein LEL_05943 [Akanthomyces lecanii RCEF 1005]|uniref:Uncharacterized protein n=1 Tax=Akanthomyces lecanii RCEF 1005 TaxID=1081108 RepID=A0A168GB04_CORDF|nr:hypothetical protein LEL_05943 [Akanthomyces lecanii RCEF 1005]